jgi:hypothetical protein
MLVLGPSELGSHMTYNLIEVPHLHFTRKYHYYIYIAGARENYLLSLYKLESVYQNDDLCHKFVFPLMILKTFFFFNFPHCSQYKSLYLRAQVSYTLGLLFVVI